MHLKGGGFLLNELGVRVVGGVVGGEMRRCLMLRLKRRLGGGGGLGLP